MSNAENGEEGERERGNGVGEGGMGFEEMQCKKRAACLEMEESSCIRVRKVEAWDEEEREMRK